MSRKKPQKPKKVENDIDINNIDVMFEDMKNLVLEKVEEKEETKDIVVAHEDANDEEIMNKDNVVISDEIKEDFSEPNSCFTLSRISAAALLVNVTAQIC